MIVQNSFDTPLPVPVSKGGTGVGRLRRNGLLVGTDTAKVSSVLLEKGSILSANAAGHPVALVGGEDNRVLVADSSSPNGVAWANVAELGAFGAWIPLQCTEIEDTVDAVWDREYITSAFDHYVIIARGLLPAISGSKILLNQSDDNGETFISDPVELAKSVSKNMVAEIHIYIDQDCVTVRGHSSYIDTSNELVKVLSYGEYVSDYVTNAIQLTASSGVLKAGRATLYGIREE
jgi:hypothetical protein